jgi:hypothetical protein
MNRTSKTEYRLAAGRPGGQFDRERRVGHRADLWQAGSPALLQKENIEF